MFGAGCAVPMSLKLRVSTTSVSPSQRPRESPRHCWMCEASAGRPSSGTIRTSFTISLRIATWLSPWNSCM